MASLLATEGIRISAIILVDYACVLRILLLLGRREYLTVPYPWFFTDWQVCWVTEVLHPFLLTFNCGYRNYFFLYFCLLRIG